MAVAERSNSYSKAVAAACPYSRVGEGSDPWASFDQEKGAGRCGGLHRYLGGIQDRYRMRALAVDNQKVTQQALVGVVGLIRKNQI